MSSNEMTAADDQTNEVLPSDPRDGGYDDGYRLCPQFWPDTPGSLLVRCEEMGLLRGGAAVDLGCGEGTNAAWLAARGFDVEAMDVSALALGNAQRRHPNSSVSWRIADATKFDPDREYDLTIAYGLMHCLHEADIHALIERVGRWSVPGGLFTLVAFNDRSQDLERAHPGFHPTLLSHAAYLQTLVGWDIQFASDEDLYEAHPHNGIQHHHSMTRIIARRSV